MKFKFKHAESGEIREVELPDKFIRESMEDEAYDQLTCDCEPVGETLVVECDCEGYLEFFELMEDDEQEQA